MRRAAKVDRNQKAIVEAYRERGAGVLSLAPMGKGVPDLLILYCKRLWLVEVKMPDGTLTEAQQAFFEGWPVTIVRSVEDVHDHLDHIIL